MAAGVAEYGVHGTHDRETTWQTTRSLSHENFNDFHTTLKAWRKEMTQFLRQPVITELGYQDIFDEVSKNFKDRKRELDKCVNKLKEDIKEIGDSLSKENDEESRRLKKMDLNNKEMFKYLAEKELEKEDKLKSDAIKHFMKNVNTELNRDDSPEA